MARRYNAAIFLLCLWMLTMLGGCQTARGAFDGIQKDASSGFAAVLKLDKWMKEHLW